MAETQLSAARPSGDHAPLLSLFDADLASRNPLAAEARAATLVSAVDADDSAYRARLIELFIQARGDWDVEVHLLDEARRYDGAHRDRPPLFDELHAIELFGTQYSEAA